MLSKSNSLKKMVMVNSQKELSHFNPTRYQTQCRKDGFENPFKYKSSIWNIISNIHYIPRDGAGGIVVTIRSGELVVTRFAITSRWQRKQQLLQLLFLAEGHIMMINLLSVPSQLSLSIKLFPCTDSHCLHGICWKIYRKLVVWMEIL